MKRELNTLMTVLTAVGLVSLAFGAPEARGAAAPGRGTARAGTAGNADKVSKQGGSSGAGRGADSPAQIPPQGWWDILKRTAAGVSEDRLMTEAAGITFYSLLALFPAMAALVSLYGLVADPKTIGDQVATLSSVVPGGGMDIIKEQLQRLTSNSGQALGFGAIVGLLASLWSSNQGTKALFDALNVVYEEKEKRGFFFRTAQTLGFTLGGIVFIILAMSGVVVLPTVLNFVGLGAWRAGRCCWPWWPCCWRGSTASAPAANGRAGAG
jgi:membrane protein